MERYLLRVWLPNRPGALGAVASRIGAVKGDVTGIEILETGSGQAVDELVVQIPDATLMELLVSEVRQVDGVEVEEVRPLGAGEHDPRLAILATASAVVAAEDPDAVVEAVCELVPAAVAASWVAIVDIRSATLVGAGDQAPTEAWLVAFVEGSASAIALIDAPHSGDASSNDVIWSAVGDTGLALVAGRDQLAWRDRERRELDGLARLISLRWQSLTG